MRIEIKTGRINNKHVCSIVTKDWLIGRTILHLETFKSEKELNAYVNSSHEVYKFLGAKVKVKRYD